MCGRYTLKATSQQVARLFDLPETPEVTPSYNIAPTQDVPVVIEEDSRRLETMRWGLIPSWADDPSIGSRMINARAETVAEKPSFRVAFKRRRGLIVADGFFEWQKTYDGKQPHYLRLKDGEPFAFAGLWESWRVEGGEEIRSCTIITTEPNELAAEIHNRMPVILPSELYDPWLDPKNDDREELLAMLQPYPAEQMTAHPVSRYVNKPANNDPSVIEPE
ncbi:SOS response-associated peptidase [soil metagenome]